MTLETQVRHHSKIGYIFHEEVALDLLKEIRTDISKINLKYKKASLNEILKIVNSEFDLRISKNGVELRVNFDSAKRLLTDYNKSAMGCYHCIHREGFKPVQDDTARYCSTDENPDSPKIKKYGENGCERQKAEKGHRPLFEILKD